MIILHELGIYRIPLNGDVEPMWNLEAFQEKTVTSPSHRRGGA